MFKVNRIVNFDWHNIKEKYLILQSYTLFRIKCYKNGQYISES